MLPASHPVQAEGRLLPEVHPAARQILGAHQIPAEPRPERMEDAPELRPDHPALYASGASGASLLEAQRTQAVARPDHCPETAAAAPELRPDPVAEAAQKSVDRAERRPEPLEALCTWAADPSAA